MPGLTIRRHDFHIAIAARKGEAIVLTLDWGGKRLAGQLSAVDALLARSNQHGKDPVPGLFSSLNIAGEFAAFRDSVQPPSYDSLNRVTLQVDDARLSGLHWERLLREAAGDAGSNFINVPVVRVSPVRPRVAHLPFTFPLRFLQLGVSEIKVEESVKLAFGGYDLTTLTQTVLFHAEDSGKSASFELPGNWKTADVLHLGPGITKRLGKNSIEPRCRRNPFAVTRCGTQEIPRSLPRAQSRRMMFCGPTVALNSCPASKPYPGVDFMQTADPLAESTLGWLLRATDIWRTRLVVMEASDVTSAVRARRMGAALVARGGPAVLVGPSMQAKDFYDRFYDALVHDNPIDQAVAAASEQDRAAADLYVTLFGGSGREELVRVSASGQRLHDLAEGLTATNPDERAKAAAELWSSLSAPGEPLASVAPRFHDSLDALVKFDSNWKSARFNLHEREGFIPLSNDLQAIRSAALPKSGATLESMTISPAQEPERFVNPSLWHFTDNGATQRIDPKGAALTAGEPIVLGIQIGPKDVTVTVLETRALIEEPFHWEEGHEGVWLTIGVSGIDFDVQGDPVQDVWLPRTGASDLVEFTIVPRTSGAWFLRFCIYFGSDLLQSYRLAAVVGDGFAEPLAKRRALSRILDVPEERLADLAYAARLEYAATADMCGAKVRDNVALSVFANAVDDRRVITTRSKENFGVAVNNDVAEIGERIRRLLDEASTQQIASIKRYAFTSGAAGYEGSWDHLNQSLLNLAAPGWELYSSIIEDDNQAKLQAELEQGGTIHVGHALLENVLPWALIYDRKYEPDQRRTEGLKALHATCRAGVEQAQAGLPRVCGTHPDCPLAPAQLESQRARGGPLASAATIVCPRHFWGFRHMIELPPVQVGADGKSSSSRPDKVLAKTPAVVMIGYNGTLPQAAQHLAELKTGLAANTIKSEIRLETTDRDELTKQLDGAAVDLVYLFCHARGGRADPTIKPARLELQGQADPDPGFISAAALRGLSWSHRPLVFFNGCNTAIFSPDALSPFIEAVVRDSKASGAIGTEIPVFQELAAEVAKLFLARFLNGKSAGEALLEIRMEMLSRLNPLGLAYTLYAFNELSVVQSN